MEPKTVLCEEVIQAQKEIIAIQKDTIEKQELTIKLLAGMIMDVKNLVAVNDDTLKRLMGEKEKKEEKENEK